MLKRILAMFCFLLFIPFGTFAISINELEANPDRYEKIEEDFSLGLFADTQSIKSLRYSPPFYTIQITEYLVYFNRNKICEFSVTLNYDYNQSFDSLFSKTSTENKYWNVDKVLEEIFLRVQKDSGITNSLLPGNTYALDGSLLEGSSGNNKPHIKKITFGTNAYFVANLVFKRYYDIDFWPL